MSEFAKLINAHTADWTTWGDSLGPEDCDYYTCLCKEVRWHVNTSTDYYQAHAEHVAEKLLEPFAGPPIQLIPVNAPFGGKP